MTQQNCTFASVAICSRKEKLKKPRVWVKNCTSFTLASLSWHYKLFSVFAWFGDGRSRRNEEKKKEYIVSVWNLVMAVTTLCFPSGFFFSSPGHLTNGGSSGSLKHQRNFVPFFFSLMFFDTNQKTRVNSYVCSTSAIGWGPARCLLLQNFIPSSSSCVRGSASLMHARARGVRSPCNTPVAVIPVWRVPWLATLVGGGMCVVGGNRKIWASQPARQSLR